MHDYSRNENIDPYEYGLDDFIESEMNKVRDNALRKVSSILIHHENLFLHKDFALTLAYGYFDSYSPTQNIANSLDLGKLDFLAIMDDFEAFKEEYSKELELAQNF